MVVFEFVLRVVGVLVMVVVVRIIVIVGCC